jgi:ribose 5-phosphate isomerase B
MKTAIASDHAGIVLKDEIRGWLREHGHDVDDLGPMDTTSVDYPDFAAAVARGVSAGTYTRGVLICGSGIGMCITANKFKGVRAALCTNDFMARMARSHNDANVLCMGARVLGVDMAVGIVKEFFSTEFSEGRHRRRVDKIAEIEKAN